MVNYKPYTERTPDFQYKSLLRNILENGEWVNAIQGERSLMIVGAQLRFKMENGFPMITERDLSGRFFEGALGEHIGFLNGAQTHEELSKFGCPWWKRWVSKAKCEIFGLQEGDLGPASYGAVWTRFPTNDGGTFDQIVNAIELLKKCVSQKRFLRTIRISNWYSPWIIGPDGSRKVVVAACHGDIHIIYFPEKNEIVIHHVQRSGDTPVGIVFNFKQYAAFGMMSAQITDTVFRELVYTISDAHIYEGQISYVEELLSRETAPFPTVTLKQGNGNIKDFRPSDFVLSDYHPCPAMVIPTPV